MATVVNTYARAFADVVIGSRLDAARTLATEPIEQPDELTARDCSPKAFVVAHAAIFESRARAGNFSARNRTRLQ